MCPSMKGADYITHIVHIDFGLTADGRVSKSYDCLPIHVQPNI